MTNPAIHEQPNGDVDIVIPDRGKPSETAIDEQPDVAAGPGPEPTVDPANLDHPEELMGE